MRPSLAEQINRSLDESRTSADRTVAEGATRAAELSVGAGRADRVLIETRLGQLAQLRADIELDRIRIDAAFLRLAEGMTATSAQLVEVARHADFSPPPWPQGLARTVEIKLSETREVTIRFPIGGPRASGSAAAD